MNKPLEPTKVDYVAETNISSIDTALKPSVSVVIEPPGPGETNNYYIAVTDYDQSFRGVSGTETFLDTIEVPTARIKKQSRNKLDPQVVYVSENVVLGNNLVTHFYVGSVTIVGLYIFYRIMVKNG